MLKDLLSSYREDLGKEQFPVRKDLVLHLDEVDVVAAVGQQGEGAALHVPPVSSESIFEKQIISWFIWPLLRLKI